jgi:tetratricopeptide (TPR) repeat protein
MLENNTLSLMHGAMEAANDGDYKSARRQLSEFDRAFSRERNAATEYEQLTVLSAVGGVYKQIGESDTAITYLQKACACAEKVAPGTSATAGDYSTLSEMLADRGRFKEAISALESAIRHLRACGEWERYKGSYERFLTRLKEDAAAG